jgi:hypothetical protein
MKQCTKCLEVKEISEFNKHKSMKDGLQYSCKACKKQYYLDKSEAILQKQKQYYQDNLEKILEQRKQWRKQNAESISEQKKQWRESLKDGLHRVYILPDHHYAGTTECIVHRMHQHRSEHGRNTSNYEIVGVYTNREDAKNHERRLHDEGYNGRHIKNNYK